MKKVVIRKCIVTGESHEKKALIRVVRTPIGEVVIDKSGRLNGRGAYVVRRKEAILQAKKKNSFGRALEVEIPESLYLELLELVSE
ncbi:MAG: YlxR family protein [Bacilli bacterium]|nr:YlxR family protein [Bacilli bacterium]